MKFRYTILIPLPFSPFSWAPASSVHAQDNDLKFKLKPGAVGKLCLECHVAFKEKLAKPSVHTPLKKGECTGCHDPHSLPRQAACGRMPAASVPPATRAWSPPTPMSVHKVVADGACTKCHDPHSGEQQVQPSQRRGTISAPSATRGWANGLPRSNSSTHPVGKGCLTCHDPHASGKGRVPPEKQRPALCIGCHKTDRPNFIKSTWAIPVANARCTGCHDPHGSDVAGILYSNVHKPVAQQDVQPVP